MVIALTGFMGSGKSTVGKVLADFLGCPFYDLDTLVVAEAGHSIPEVFAVSGEAAFRELEAKVLRRFLAKYGESTVILALGGGTLGTPASARLVAEKTTCIYLEAGVETLAERLAPEAAGRPLLRAACNGGQSVSDGLREHIAELLEARRATYEATAHVTVRTDGLTPEEIADDIIISCL